VFTSLFSMQELEEARCAVEDAVEAYHQQEVARQEQSTATVARITEAAGREVAMQRERVGESGAPAGRGWRRAEIVASSQASSWALKPSQTSAFEPLPTRNLPSSPSPAPSPRTATGTSGGDPPPVAADEDRSSLVESADWVYTGIEALKGVGRVRLEAIVAAHGGSGDHRLFARIDPDGDGLVDRKEWEGFIATSPKATLAKLRGNADHRLRERHT